MKEGGGNRSQTKERMRKVREGQLNYDGRGGGPPASLHDGGKADFKALRQTFTCASGRPIKLSNRLFLSPSCTMQC
jgi:hypothetical protein